MTAYDHKGELQGAVNPKNGMSSLVRGIRAFI